MSILLMASNLNIPNLSLRARSRYTLVLAQSYSFHTIDFRTLYTAVQLWRATADEAGCLSLKAIAVV